MFARCSLMQCGCLFGREYTMARHEDIDSASSKYALLLLSTTKTIMMQEHRSPKRPDSQIPYRRQMYKQSQARHWLRWSINEPTPSFPPLQTNKTQNNRCIRSENAIPQILQPIWAIPNHPGVYNNKNGTRRKGASTDLYAVDDIVIMDKKHR